MYNPIEVRKNENYNVYKSNLVEEHVCMFAQSALDYMEIEPLYNDINKYVTQVKIKWISGERSIESEWSNYQNVLKSMNVDEYISIYQDVHDNCKFKEWHYPHK